MRAHCRTHEREHDDDTCEGRHHDEQRRDLQVLRKADLLIAKIWLNVLARLMALFSFASLVGVFGLGMANLAAYNALQPSIGVIWSASAVAVADLTAALIDERGSAPPGFRNCRRIN